MKITFGIQPHHIKTIERIIKAQNDLRDDESIDLGIDHAYSEWVWEKIGRELGWKPFTICLAYFEHLNDMKGEKL